MSQANKYRTCEGVILILPLTRSGICMSRCMQNFVFPFVCSNPINSKQLRSPSTHSLPPGPLDSTSVPFSGGVCPPFGSAWGGGGMGRGHRGGGVSLGDGHFLGFAGLLSAVWTEALAPKHGRTGSVEPMGDGAVRLALHEGTLWGLRRREKSWFKLWSETEDCKSDLGLDLRFNTFVLNWV